MNAEENAENIYLVGLMAAGKTSIGRLLAREIGREFVNTDQVIVARTGVGIPTIFAIEGEEGFRKREAQIVSEIAARSGYVVATGGGTVLMEENRNAMRLSGVVAYLNAMPQVQYERIRRDRNRPLLQVPDPLARLMELRAERDPLYREVADVVIDCGRMSGRAVLQLLIREIESLWKR